MNRFFSTLTVLAILLFAVGLSLRQSIIQGGDATSLAAQALVGAGLIGTTVVLVRRRYLRSKKINGAGRGADRPLRRLLSAVWS